VIQAIGSSSIEKGNSFAQTHIPGVDVTIYDTYEQVYADEKVDVVYVATPATFHKKNCLDAIAAGKHVLCEKPFTITAPEARDVVEAARAKGVFLMEGMWLRFRPLVRELQKKLHEEQVVGDVNRVLCDLSMYFGVLDKIRSRTEPSEHPALPPGMMLEAGVYPLTWGLLALEEQPGRGEERPQILAASKLCSGVDVATSVILHYPTSGRQAILSMSMETKSDRAFCRIEGTKGHIDVEGPVASHPESFTIFHKSDPEVGVPFAFNKAGQTFTFKQKGWGFYYEADAVALDIAAGRKENSIMPWNETVRVMKIVDEIRRQGGVRFPQDSP